MPHIATFAPNALLVVTLERITKIFDTQHPDSDSAMYQVFGHGRLGVL